MTKIFSDRFGAFSVSLSVSLLFILLALSEINVPLLSFAELQTRDLRFLMRGKQTPESEVVIVAIDDKSLESIGRWPWSRSVVARLIGLLKQGGAKCIALDLLFTEPEINQEKQQIGELISAYTQLGLLDTKPEHQAFFGKMAEAAAHIDNDALLAEAIRDAKTVVLPMVFASETVPNETSPLMRPIPILAQAASRMGFANVIPDSDGAVRRSLAVAAQGETVHFSLAVRAVQKHLKIKSKEVMFFPGTEIRLGTYAIPLNDDGTFHINYYGPNGTIPSYSFADVLNKEIPPEVFEGKTVFVGGSATGLGDHWANPFAANFPGVEIQATAADNILRQRFLRRPSWAKYADAAVLAMIGLVLSVSLVRLPMKYVAPFSVGLAVFFILANQYAFAYHRLILLWIYPLLNIGIITLGIFVRRYLTEGHEKRILKQAFRQYLSPSVVDRIVAHPESLSLGGEKKELTVLFSDIRDFTSISENLTPEALVLFMNRYLTAMTDIVMKNEGTLDKYVGDAIMAIYGAPQEQKDHVIRACRSAIDMFEILYEKREMWTREGLPPVRIGVGINTGPMVVGNMGSEKRFEYTVMGDHVNLASRLEGLTKVYGAKIVVSEYVHAKAKDEFVFRELDIVRVKGRHQSIRIFELLGKDYHTQGKYAFVPAFRQGLEAYRQGEWDAAIRFFRECLALKPQDRPSLLYIERCDAMKSCPPDSNWDGVLNLSEKKPE